MKDYKYIIFDKDIKVYPANEIIYHKEQFYEIIEIRIGSGGGGMIVRTKYPDGWKFAIDGKLFTKNDIRRLKLDLIRKKL